jgi:hypothetical protein
MTANNAEPKHANAQKRCSDAAWRMRLRRRGLQCLLVELRETEIDALIRKGLLKAETRHDLLAVRKALYSYLDQTLT